MLDTMTRSIEEIQDRHEMLRDLPENQSIFKCYKCRSIFDLFNGDLPIFMALCGKEGVICPVCKSDSTSLICKADAFSIYLKLKGFKCRDGQQISGVDICPVCYTNMCPRCFNHECLSLSRVTGYMSDVSGWNAAKKQELADRKRYKIDKPKILACEGANILTQC